jgi:Aldo/keto reductase family
VDEVRADLAGTGLTLAQAALKFVLAHPAVSTVIPGIRNPAQAAANCAVSDLPDLPAGLLERLHRHNCRRGVWSAGKQAAGGRLPPRQPDAERGPPQIGGIGRPEAAPVR